MAEAEVKEKKKKLKTKAAAPVVASDKLMQLASLSRALVAANKAEAEAEQKFKDAKEARRLIEEEDIPSVMTEIGVDKIRLTTGEEISVKSSVNASITKEKNQAACEWLFDHGFGGLVKTEVNILFNRDSVELAAELADELRENGFEPEFTIGVHASTVKAFVNEQLAAGKDIPMELFSAQRYQKATVKAAPPSFKSMVASKVSDDDLPI